MVELATLPGLVPLQGQALRPVRRLQEPVALLPLKRQGTTREQPLDP